MFWFNKQDSRAVFVDKRRETHALPDVSSAGGVRTLEINPDIVADFTNLPFPAGHFAMVVFDPPHLVRAGKKGWQAKKYGRLEGDWREMIRRGFAECFRVLKPEGTLIFKWNEHEVPVSQILKLTPERPLVGQRCGKAAKTHWLVFMKSSANGCPKCKRPDLRILTWRECGSNATSLGCWDCDWITFPPGITAENWQELMRNHQQRHP